MNANGGETSTSSTTQPVVPIRSPEQEPTEYWRYELFGCLADWRLCLATFCVPCYTLGRNAEYFGENAVASGLGYCLGVWALAPMLRWRLRQHRHLHGSMLTDAVVHMCCPCCALIQENRELYGFAGAHIGEHVPLNVEITRK